MLLGIWKNIEELEESLCLAELELILESSREEKRQQNRFLAALQGVDLDKEQHGDLPTFDDIKRRAQGKMTGKSEEEIDFAEVGIEIEEWED